jgi:hypothetical protein
MYIHILSCCCRLSGVVLQHPMSTLWSDPILASSSDPILSSTGDPILLSLGTPYFFFRVGNPQVTAHGLFPSLSLEGTSSHTWVWGYGFYAKDSDQWCQLQWGARCRVANSRNRTAVKSILFTYVPGAGICNEICMVFKLVVQLSETLRCLPFLDPRHMMCVMVICMSGCRSGSCAASWPNLAHTGSTANLRITARSATKFLEQGLAMKLVWGSRWLFGCQKHVGVCSFCTLDI